MIKAIIPEISWHGLAPVPAQMGVPTTKALGGLTFKPPSDA